jgi:rhamnogalacturonyl hydrolase YesR/ligand-binding sensor domain-containing protein
MMIKHIRKNEKVLVTFICLVLLLSFVPRAGTEPTSSVLPVQAQTGTWTTYANGDDVQALAVDGDYLWAGTRGGGIVRWNMTDGSYVQYLYPQSGISSNNVKAIAIDGEGKVWIGTQMHWTEYDIASPWGGVSVFDGTTWTSYNKDNSGLASNNVEAIAIDGEGKLWFGTYGGGISVFDGNTWTTYTTDNSGLASNYVRAIAIDREGQVWFGTANGLSVFDGSTWTTYTRDNSGLPCDDLVAIATDRSGNVWVRTMGQEACWPYDVVGVFDGVTWTTYPTIKEAVEARYSDILTTIGKTEMWTIQPPDKVWTADLGRSPWGVYGVSVFDGSTWTTYNVSNSELLSNDVQAIAIDGEGKIWFGTTRYWTGSGYASGGISVFDGNIWTTYTTAESGLVSNEVYSIAVDGTGRVWFGTARHWTGSGYANGEVSAFDGVDWATYPTIRAAIEANYSDILTSMNKNSMWTVQPPDKVWTTEEKGVSVFDGTSWTTYTLEDTRYRGNPVTTVAKDTPAGSYYVPVEFGSGEEADAALSSGYVMFGTDSTVYRYEWYLPGNHSIIISPPLQQDLSAGVLVYAVEVGLAGNSVTAIAADGDGRMWFGAGAWAPFPNGISVFDGSTWIHYNSKNSGLASDHVNAIAIGKDGKAWIGTGDKYVGCCTLPPPGVSVFDGTTWTNYSQKDGLSSDYVITIVVDEIGRVWCGTGEWEWTAPCNGVSVFDGTKWTTYKEDDGLAPGQVNTIAFDEKGNAWAGTEGGLSVFEGSNWTSYTTNNSGLVSSKVNAIAVDGAGNVWIGTSCGVSKYTPPAALPPPCINSTIIKVAERTMQMELPGFEWGEGLATYGLLATWQVTGDDRYFDFVKDWLDEVLDVVPEDSYVDLTSGPSLLIVYEKTGEQKYLEKAIKLAERLINEQPRWSEGHFIGEGEHSIIVNGLLAVCPFLARLGHITSNSTYLDEAARQVALYAKDLQDESGLFYHGADLITGGHLDNAFWERGNGWAALCIVEVLSFLPPDHPQQGKLIEILEKQVQALAPLQDESGLWHTVVDRLDFYLETSGALAIGYGIRKAIQDGHLGHEYWNIAERIARGARAKVAPDGTVLDVSGGTGIGPDVGYYNLIPHDQIQLWGQGLYLLFACQVPCHSIYLPNVQKNYSR